MPRLFTAIALPEPLREKLSDLEEPMPGARWIEEDNLHITLRFAGDVDNRVADEFASALSNIALDAFSLRLNGLGTFGGSDPRTLYATVAPSPQLEALARAHERAARGAGLAPEGRTFKGHVTLARLKHARSDTVARYLQRHGAFRSEPFAVTEFLLMSSRPNVGGGPYVEEEVFPLSQGRYAATGS